MHKAIFIFCLPLVLFLNLPCRQAQADDGLIRVQSSHGVTATIDRLESALNTKGMTVFTRISHSDGAKKAGLELRPTELLIFGNPKAGTPLMLCSQTAALDLPQKALAYEDAGGRVWLVYNDPAWLAARHNISACGNAVSKISAALAGFASTATR